MLRPSATPVLQTHPTVHLLIDMVNPLDFPGGDRLLAPALVAARHIAALKKRLRAAGVPTVYVNDNFGHWELGFRELVALYRGSGAPGAALLQHVAPEPGDHFVLKPKHSGFYATSLEVLLRSWDTRRLILTGIQGNICVMFTADDAHMRELEVVVPHDCIACEDAEWQHWAVRQLGEVIHADTRGSKSVDLRSRTARRRPTPQAHRGRSAVAVRPRGGTRPESAAQRRTR